MYQKNLYLDGGKITKKYKTLAGSSIPFKKEIFVLIYFIYIKRSFGGEYIMICHQNNQDNQVENQKSTINSLM